MQRVVWKVTFVLIALATVTVLLPQVNSTMISGKTRRSVILRTAARRSRSSQKPQRRVQVAGGAPLPLRQRHRDIDFVGEDDDGGGGTESGRFVPRDARRVYVTAGGRVHFVKRARGVRVRWNGGRAPRDRPTEGYVVEAVEGDSVRLQGGSAFLNPSVELTRIGPGEDADVRLAPGSARPSVRKFAAATAEMAAVMYGREARVLVVCEEPTAAADLANQVRLCFSAPVRAVAPGSTLEVRDGAVVVDGVPYPGLLEDLGGRGDGPLSAVQSVTKSRVTLADGSKLSNPVRVARTPEFGDGVDLCIVQRQGADDGSAAFAGPVLTVAPNAPLDSLVAAVPTVVWVPLRASLPAATEAERLNLLELDAAVTGESDVGEFRALLRGGDGSLWRTLASCRLVPGRMADVRVFAEDGASLSDLVPPGAPPDCTEPDVAARLVVRSMSGHEDVAVGTFGGLGGGAVHGSQSAVWRLECPQSGPRTLKVVGPVLEGQPRSVVQVPERCNVPPCLSSRDVE